MCAVFGFLDYKGKVSNAVLKKLIHYLSVAAEVRGTDATGIAYVRDGSIVTYKKPKPAHKVKLFFPRDTRAVIGHTRFTTQGSEKRNCNNHPFDGHCGTEAFALAHNGVLYNDKELRREQHLPPTPIETDTYVAVQLLEQEQQLDKENIKRMAELVEGSFVFTILRNDNTLFLVKGNNPLTLYHFPKIGLYVYASTKSILDNALKEVELSATVKPVPVQVATATTQIKCVYGQDMDEIDLQNYVKNADAVGGVSVKVATGSTMLDGMQLDGSKLSGKPAKTYTDGKDVTFTFTAKNGNTANLTLHFLVAKADPTVKVTVDGDTHTEGDLVSELKLILSGNNTKGLAEIISEIKALTAGENTLTWKFTPEDGENYNVVTGTVVVNAQTTTTTTTTTTTNETTSTSETTSTTKATTATSETTSMTKATTATSETTATTEETTTTNEITATTEETTVTTNGTTATTEVTTTTNETTVTTEETTTTNETTATTEETTVITSETTATTEETTATNVTTATIEETTTTNETTATTAETTTTNETTVTTEETTTNETTATTEETTTNETTAATGETTTNGTTSATKATTATSGTTATASATQTTTITSASSTESTAATSATTITTAATTSVTNIADDDLCSWAINDYQKKAGIVPANAEITARSEGACEITLTDENGNVLDVYTIDPKTGTGTDSSNAEVNLPQTGNNSMTNWLLCVGAAMFMAFGFGAVKASGILKRKEDE